MKNAARGRHFGTTELLVCLFGFALLVGNAAAGFASGLAGSLAFAATAVFRAVAQIFGFQSGDVFHI